MATAASIRDIKEFVYEWEGKDRHGKIVRGKCVPLAKTRCRLRCAVKAYFLQN